MSKQVQSSNYAARKPRKKIRKIKKILKFFVFSKEIPKNRKKNFGNQNVSPVSKQDSKFIKLLFRKKNLKFTKSHICKKSEKI